KKSVSMLVMGAAALGLALTPVVFGQTNPDQPSGAKKSSKNSEQSANRLAAADSTFVTKAAEGGMAEVELGNLAKTNGSNTDVKSFGEQMVTDHSKASDDLKTIASQKGITLPTSVNSKQKAEFNRLQKLQGADFDREYMKLMVSDHRTDVNEFKKESEHGSDPDIKAFASKTLPTLQSHLQMAESTDAKVKGEKSSKSPK